jgi:hypothetical protein
MYTRICRHFDSRDPINQGGIDTSRRCCCCILDKGGLLTTNKLRPCGWGFGMLCYVSTHDYCKCRCLDGEKGEAGDSLQGRLGKQELFL